MSFMVTLFMNIHFLDMENKSSQTWFLIALQSDLEMSDDYGWTIKSDQQKVHYVCTLSYLLCILVIWVKSNILYCSISFIGDCTYNLKVCNGNDERAYARKWLKGHGLLFIDKVQE